MREKIKEYWEERAKQNPTTPSVTTNDVHLRELEIVTVIQALNEVALPKNSTVLDIGCGDGYSTLRVAQAMRELCFVGIDYSVNMIKSACEQQRLQPELKDRVAFYVGDVTSLDQVCGKSMYDAVLSDRCLINLESSESQSHAISEIANHIKPGGYFIAIENFIEGQDEMNKARYAVGLPDIPVRWHNLYFKEDEFICNADRFFTDIFFKDFSSSYYFATRVIYSAMCQMRGENPDYNHEIHRLAVRLPWMGRFSPIERYTPEKGNMTNRLLKKSVCGVLGPAGILTYLPRTLRFRRGLRPCKRWAGLAGPSLGCGGIGGSASGGPHGPPQINNRFLNSLYANKFFNNLLIRYI